MLCLLISSAEMLDVSRDVSAFPKHSVLRIFSFVVSVASKKTDTGPSWLLKIVYVNVIFPGSLRETLIPSAFISAEDVD